MRIWVEALALKVIIATNRLTAQKNFIMVIPFMANTLTNP